MIIGLIDEWMFLGNCMVAVLLGPSEVLVVVVVTALVVFFACRGRGPKN